MLHFLKETKNMGTRGFWGITKNGEVKMIYNSHDKDKAMIAEIKLDTIKYKDIEQAFRRYEESEIES